MTKLICVISTVICILLTACEDDSSIGVIGGADGPTSIIVAEEGEKIMYEQINQEEAKKIMDSGEEHIVLDVREQDEFDAGYIPGAICIPNETIGEKEIPELPDKDAKILIYCRSGNRSVQATEKLVKLGYTNLIEIGGIIDYTGEISSNN